MGFMRDAANKFADEIDSRLDEIDHRLDCLADRMLKVECKDEPKPDSKEPWPPYIGHGAAEVETCLLGKRVSICDGSYAVTISKDGRLYHPHVAYYRSDEYRSSWLVIAERCRLPTANGHHQDINDDLRDEPFNDVILRSDDGLIVFSQARFVKVV